jgi:rhomboid family GlyGly-CTERM serine protease
MAYLHYFAEHQYLIFATEAVSKGEVWRILTGQLLHINDNHLLLNIAGLALVWALHGEHYPNGKFILILLLALCVVGIGTFFSNTADSYYGLSGILHFFLAWGACLDIKYLDQPLKNAKLNLYAIANYTGILLLLGLFLKIIFENTIGGTEETAELIGATVAVEVHAIGVVSATVIFFAVNWLANKKGYDNVP